MHTLEELNAHYKSVRQRLNAGPPPKMEKSASVIKPELQLVIKPPQVITPAPQPEPQDFRTRAQKIVSEVAAAHNMTAAELKSQNRTRPFILARQEAYYRLSTELRYSLKQMGMAVGFRDHTTVLSSLQRYKRRMNITD